MIDDLLTPAEAGRVMGLCGKRVQQMCAARQIEHVAYRTVYGRVYRYRVRRSVAEDWVRWHTVPRQQ